MEVVNARLEMTRRVKDARFTEPWASVTESSKEKVPGAEGVPLRVPEASTARPPGRDPLLRMYARGALPPEASMRTAYETPTAAGGREAVTKEGASRTRSG